MLPNLLSYIHEAYHKFKIREPLESNKCRKLRLENPKQVPKKKTYEALTLDTTLPLLIDTSNNLRECNHECQMCPTCVGYILDTPSI